MHRPTLAELLRAHGEHYRGEHRLSVAQAKAWRAIVDCRTVHSVSKTRMIAREKCFSISTSLSQ